MVGRIMHKRELSANIFRCVSPKLTLNRYTSSHFFVDAETYMSYGGELDATEQDLHDLGIETVDIPRGYASDLGDRIPIRVRATARGLKAYARLIHLHDPLQIEEMERVISGTQ